ncbi:MAG: GNAT family N-acetyltransferase [Phycisphaeraceae bacterium]|nr:GNAT family N-acetyltransferase [Phycisphaeraceae bacterium]
MPKPPDDHAARSGERASASRCPAAPGEWFAAPRLGGRFVRLEPLHPDHADALFDVGDPRTFLYHLTVPAAWTREAFGEYIARLLAMTDRVTLAMLDAKTGSPIGASAYLEIRPAHRALEIGATWITPSRRGTAINPESKLLMLSHAFDTLGAIRVQLKCDARNLQSRRAIAKLGATEEGTLRDHMLAPNGSRRNTVFFSILEGEWADVRKNLERRLEALGVE